MRIVYVAVCVAVPVEWGGGAAGRWARGAAAGAGGAGLAGAAICAAAFWRHRSTPVVKSASRELSVLTYYAYYYAATG